MYPRVVKHYYGLRFGFLEGIWYLDIVHNGHVPKARASGGRR